MYFVYIQDMDDDHRSIFLITLTLSFCSVLQIHIHQTVDHDSTRKSEPPPDPPPFILPFASKSYRKQFEFLERKKRFCNLFKEHVWFIRDKFQREIHLKIC